jgi:hypothetical protein
MFIVARRIARMAHSWSFNSGLAGRARNAATRAAHSDGQRSRALSCERFFSFPPTREWRVDAL